MDIQRTSGFYMGRRRRRLDHLASGLSLSLPQQLVFCRAHSSWTDYTDHVVLGPKPRSAAMINGRRCARANASATMGDAVSLRMTLPMDMKKLFAHELQHLSAFYCHQPIRLVVQSLVIR